MVFNSVWSLLVLAYLALAPTYAGALFHRLVAAAITGVTAVFWFAGAIALAVVAGGGVWGAAAAFGFFLWWVSIPSLPSFPLLAFLRACVLANHRRSQGRLHRPLCARRPREPSRSYGPAEEHTLCQPRSIVTSDFTSQQEGQVLSSPANPGPSAYLRPTMRAPSRPSSGPQAWFHGLLFL